MSSHHQTVINQNVIIMKKEMVIGIRGDLHARDYLAQEHIQLLNTGKIDGIIDVGDIEASYLELGVHPLRAGQDPAKESTMDAVIRNALDENGKLTEVGEAAIKEDLRSINAMAKHNQLYGEHMFRCINGNSFDVKNKIFDALAPNKKYELLEAFSKYNWVMKEADAEIIDKTALVYLPWKCTTYSVEKAINSIGDIERIVLISHDFLTLGSIPKEYKLGMKEMKNEEQIVTALDMAAERTKKIEGYFGHIGFQYPMFKQDFMHKAKVSAFHVDEKYQKLLELRI